MEQVILNIVLVFAIIYIVRVLVYGLGSVAASTNRAAPLIVLLQSRA